VNAHSTGELDLSDTTKTAYSLVNHEAWAYPSGSLPYVVIVAPAPSVISMIHPITIMSQEVTIHVFVRNDPSAGLESLECAQLDQDILTEMRSIVWSIQDRDASGVDQIDINITDIMPQNLVRNHTALGGDTDGNVTQYITRFTIQYDEEY
jgi:hypothetical protein